MIIIFLFSVNFSIVNADNDVLTINETPILFNNISDNNYGIQWAMNFGSDDDYGGDLRVHNLLVIVTMMEKMKC